jgi:hypothetical protein
MHAIVAETKPYVSPTPLGRVTRKTHILCEPKTYEQIYVITNLLAYFAVIMCMPMNFCIR